MVCLAEMGPYMGGLTSQLEIARELAVYDHEQMRWFQRCFQRYTKFRIRRINYIKRRWYRVWVD